MRTEDDSSCWKVDVVKVSALSVEKRAVVVRWNGVVIFNADGILKPVIVAVEVNGLFSFDSVDSSGRAGDELRKEVVTNDGTGNDSDDN